MRWLGFEGNLPASWSAAALLHAAIPEARCVGVKFFRSINMQEVVTRTVDVSSKVAACWREEPPQTIYRSDAQCLYSQLVLVGKSSGKVCLFRRIFQVLNERKQKSRSDTNYQLLYSKSLAPNTPRTTTFSSIIFSVSLHKYCLFNTFIVVNQYI